MHSHTPQLHDVVIAGAGPVGLFLACELRLLAMEVVVAARQMHNLDAAFLRSRDEFVGARMCLDCLAQPDVLVSLNGALLPMPGLPAEVFAPVARLFASSSLAARAVARLLGGQGAVQRLDRGVEILDHDRDLTQGVAGVCFVHRFVLTWR